MEKSGRKASRSKREEQGLKELQQALLSLHDEFTETVAWTALLYDGLCGVLGEQAPDIDRATHTGARFAAIWLKGRNERHAAQLRTACSKLREIRERG